MISNLGASPSSEFASDENAEHTFNKYQSKPDFCM